MLDRLLLFSATLGRPPLSHLTFVSRFIHTDNVFTLINKAGTFHLDFHQSRQPLWSCFWWVTQLEREYIALPSVLQFKRMNSLVTFIIPHSHPLFIVTFIFSFFLFSHFLSCSIFTDQYSCFWSFLPHFQSCQFFPLFFSDRFYSSKYFLNFLLILKHFFITFFPWALF